MTEEKTQETSVEEHSIQVDYYDYEKLKIEKVGILLDCLACGSFEHDQPAYSEGNRCTPTFTQKEQNTIKKKLFEIIDLF